MLTTSVNSNSSNKNNSKTNKNKPLGEEAKSRNNGNDMMMVDTNKVTINKDKNGDVTMKDRYSSNTNDFKIPKKNKDLPHFYNRNNNNKGYKGNYRGNQNKLNHKNSSNSVMSDFSNNGRYYNSSRGGNKKNKPNYSNSSNNNNNGNNTKPPIKDIKEIQKKLDRKLSKDNSAISSIPSTSSNNNNNNNNENENTIQTQLTLDNYDPKILERRNTPSPSPPPAPIPAPVSSTETEKTKETEPTEDEDTIMTTEEVEHDFLNGFSSDKIENAGKIFIGGLTYETTDEKLREHFEQYGKITECTVMKDNNGCSRGFGFITYENPEVLDKVLEINHILDGKTIDPKRAIPRDRQDKTEKIFVGGIHPDVTEAEFKAAFDSFGKVIDATLITAKDTGKSRCFGFITYEDGRGVDVAYANRHNIVLNGKKVEVKYAAPKQKLAGGAMNPVMLNMNGMNNMNMRIPMGIPMGMGVINVPPQQPQMPPPKMGKGNISSPKNKQAQKYYQQNIRSGQVGPIRNQHNHAYPQDFQYSRYNLNMNMNMYTAYNYNPYNSAGYMSYNYDNYNMPPMANYSNPQPYANGTASYPSGYMSRNMNSYPQGHPYGGSGANTSNSSNHNNYNGHSGGRNNGNNSSNYYNSNSHGSPNNTNLPTNSPLTSNATPNYNGYNGYNMNVYGNNYVPYNGQPIDRMNSNSSSSSNGGNGNLNHNNNNANPDNMTGNENNPNENDEKNNSSLYMGVNPRNNHGYHPYSR